MARWDALTLTLKPPGKTVRFKSSEAENPGSLSVTHDSVAVVHPSYVEALQLQSRVITSLDDSTPLRTSGIITDVPESFSPASYRTRVQELTEELATLPTGQDGALKFEDLIGETVKLCFFRSLSNVMPRVRNYQTTAIRDWIASNRATAGFWAIVRQKYDATQVIWECKNYADLTSDDFQQAAYYIDDKAGRFLIMVCRAASPLSSHVFEHIGRVYQQTRGLVLVLRESDIKTFLRQALNGKQSDQHLQDIFDNTERVIA